MKKHWWSFVFSQTTNGTTTTSSVYLGWEGERNDLVEDE